MWPKRGRRATDEDKLAQSIAYENISKDSKISDLVLLYDDMNVLLFEKPKIKQATKKV